MAEELRPTRPRIDGDGRLVLENGDVVVGCEIVSVSLTERGFEAVPMDELGNVHPHYPGRPAVNGRGDTPAEAICDLMKRNPPRFALPERLDPRIAPLRPAAPPEGEGGS